MKILTEKYVVKLGLLTLVGLFSISQAVAQSGEIPRTPSGKPDLIGIWQAMTSAHYDIEPHAAAEGPHPGLLGAPSAPPAGLGIVEGGCIPYNEQARRVRDQNKANALENVPLTKVFYARRSTCELYAVSFSDCAVRKRYSGRLRVC